MVLEVLVGHLGLARPDTAPNGNAGCVHGLRITRHERVPPIEVLALGEQHVGARRRQPGDRFQAFGRELDAIIDLFQAVRVVTAAAAVAVEQAAADIGVVGPVGPLLFQLVEAATAAAVTKALPFRIGHLCQGFALPEWDVA